MLSVSIQVILGCSYSEILIPSPPFLFTPSSLLPPSLQLLSHLASSTWSRTLHLQALGTHSLTAPYESWKKNENSNFLLSLPPQWSRSCLPHSPHPFHWDKSSTKSVYSLGANTMILLPNYIFSDILMSKINNTTGSKGLAQSHICLLQSF